MTHGAPKEKLAGLTKLFPNLSEEEYAKLDAWYTCYSALILRMYERITADPEAHARFLALTSRPSRPTMTVKVDSPKQTNES